MKINFNWIGYVIFIPVDLLSELARREKDAGIFPEAEVDLFMKVNAKQATN
jgi:hypothetical protein